MKRLASLLFAGFLIQSAGAAPIRVVVWDEQQPAQKEAYPNFLGNQIASYLLTVPNLSVRSVSINDPEQGLSDSVLEDCQVLVWWGHVRHGEVSATKAKRIVQRIQEGKTCLVALHAAHWSMPFVEAMNERTRQDTQKTLGADSNLKLEYIEPPRHAPKAGEPLTPSVNVQTNPDGSKVAKVTLPLCVFPSWRADGAPSHVTTLLPDHPIAKGIPLRFDVPHTEMYNEPFHVPAPDSVIFEEKWDLGEHFRSGCVWNLGKGKIFYFRPGHEIYKVYFEPIPLQIVANAVKWLAGEIGAK